MINLALEKSDGFMNRLSRPPLFWLIGVPCTYSIGSWILGLIHHVRYGTLPEGSWLDTAIGLVFAVAFLGFEVWVTWDWMRRRFGVGKLGWIGREGVDWGPHRVTATYDALCLERDKCRTTYRWPAILGIEESRHALLLTLTPYSAVVVPKSAFASGAVEQSFRDFVDRRIEAAL